MDLRADTLAQTAAGGMRAVRIFGGILANESNPLYTRRSNTGEEELDSESHDERGHSAYFEGVLRGRLQAVVESLYGSVAGKRVA